MIEPTRRHVLASAAGAGVAVMAGTLPIAADDARLQATVKVVDAERDETGDIGYLTIRVTNERPADGEAITPVPSIWGLGRQTQLAWPAESGSYPTVPPGETVTFRADAPGQMRAVRLKPDHRALVRVFDKGTERRATDVFVPSNFTTRENVP